jgi:hypothetical protein
MNDRPPHRGLAGVARAAVLRVARTMTRHARLRRHLRALLDRFPSLQTRIHGLIHRTDALPPRRAHVPQDVLDLSPDTRALYDELKRHFDARKR